MGGEEGEAEEEGERVSEERRKERRTSGGEGEEWLTVFLSTLSGHLSKHVESNTVLP